MKRSTMTLAVLALLLGGVRQATADTITGDTLQVQYHFPNLTDLYESPYSLTVPGTTQFEFGSVTVAASPTSITAGFTASGNWISTSFNGFEVTDLTNSSRFSSVTVDPSTNMVGLTAADVSFDAGHIWVNWQGLHFDPSKHVVLDVDSSTSVPEPSRIAGMVGLASMALIGLFWFGRRAPVDAIDPRREPSRPENPPDRERPSRPRPRNSSEFPRVSHLETEEQSTTSLMRL